MKKNVFVLIFLHSVIGCALAQPTRAIYWLHGLGGNDAAWTQAVTATSIGLPDYPSRRAVNIQLGYENQTASLASAATYIQGQVFTMGSPYVNQYGLDRRNSFMIAHSQGGLVARRLDKYYNERPDLIRDINGIVTFGSPHQGAQIINSIPDFNNFITGACDDLGQGPIKEGIDNTFLVNFINTATLVNKVLDPLCTLVGNLAPLTLSQFTTQIGQDYRIGSPVLTELNNFDNNGGPGLPVPHKVAFYGVEDAPAIWRVLYNVLGKKPNDFSPFQADDDTPLLNAVTNDIANYQAKVTLAQNDYDNLGSQYCSAWQWIVASPICAIHDAALNTKRNNALTRRDAWQRGVNWWNDAPRKWNILTGAKSYVPTTVTQYDCNCSQYDYDGNLVSQWTSTTTDPNWCDSQSSTFQTCYPTNPTQGVTYTEVDKPGDGIVTAESAMNYTGVTPQNVASMPGSNHQQMRNDSNTKARLRELFDGKIYDSFFATPH